MENQPISNEKELAYDLRQVWVKLVGEQLEDIKGAKKSGIPSNYYHELEDLYDLVQQKFVNKIVTEKEIDDIRKDIITLANKNASVWLGQTRNKEKSSELDRKLRELERRLYNSMEEANMYGAKFDDDGL